MTGHSPYLADMTLPLTVTVCDCDPIEFELESGLVKVGGNGGSAKWEAHNFGSILALEASELQGLVTEFAKELEARARA